MKIKHTTTLQPMNFLHRDLCKRNVNTFSQTHRQKLYTDVQGNFTHHRPQLESRKWINKLLYSWKECHSLIKRNKLMIKAKTRTDLKIFGGWKKSPTIQHIFGYWFHLYGRWRQGLKGNWQDWWVGVWANQVHALLKNQWRYSNDYSFSWT